MRCYCCDCELSDYESTLKSPNTGAYLDTCTACLSSAGIYGVSSPSSSVGEVYFCGEEYEND